MLKKTDFSKLSINKHFKFPVCVCQISKLKMCDHHIVVVQFV